MHRSPQPPAPSPSPAMLDVLYEDNHLLAVNKPAMLPTMGVAEDRPSLLAVAKEYVRRKYNKPGNVYLGIVSRLDAPVTGVVLLARTSKAAARLVEAVSRARRGEDLLGDRRGRIEPPAGRLVDFLRKDERHRRMHIASAECAGAQRAELAYRTLRTRPGDAATVADRAWADACWKCDRSPAASIRFACSCRRPVFRLSATGNMAAGGHFRRESRCIRGGWSSSIR